MKKIILTIIILPLVAYCQSFVPNAPELDLKSYILIEPNTNTVIAEFNSSDLIEPASMTKVMTGYVVSDQIKNELISLNDQVLISEKAWKMEGSKMFIEVGKKVSILDLLKGIIIQSGNDASVAIAEYVGGTEDGFVDLMNSYAGALEMNDTNYINSTGLPAEGHLTSARDLATLTAKFINNFPDEYALYKEKEFTFNNIKQLNRNKLLWRDDTSDGVKTGHTSTAGYCLIGSAERGNMRLITVVAGSDSDNDRFLSTQRLLEYGFRFYATQKYFDPNKEYALAKVWGGRSDQIQLGVSDEISITLPRTSFKNIKVDYEYKSNVQAPIIKGQVMGSLKIISDGEVVKTADLIALENVEAKGFFGRLWSSFVLWIMSLFGIS
ncbi:D-alanyl-D-alanine carboxypeptidase [Gammaproteobacteria bacterium]|nr:D-alanyl-D-alanine carboxypeptidase [Gammaproteobacteria bacterium]